MTFDLALARRIEEISLNAWPSIYTEVYKGCILRYSSGYTKRSNSANPIYVQREDLPAVIEHSRKRFTDMNLPVIFKILSWDGYREIDNRLDGEGYTVLDKTVVMKMKLRNFSVSHHGKVKVEDRFSRQWIEAFIETNGISNQGDAAALVLERVLGKKIVVSITEGETLAAFGFGVVEDNYVGLYDVLVAEEHRGCGLGRKILETILSEAKDRGVENSFLQVVDANTKAKNLYLSLGYEPFYEYWYRKKEL